MILFDAWDPEKAEANQRNHEGITFDEAKAFFYDEAALTMVDYESDPNEERWVTIGMSAQARVLVVAYTYRGEAVRIISARKANLREHKEYSER